MCYNGSDLSLPIVIFFSRTAIFLIALVPSLLYAARFGIGDKIFDFSLPRKSLVLT